jgi:hypothetical protein
MLGQNLVERGDGGRPTRLGCWHWRRLGSAAREVDALVIDHRGEVASVGVALLAHSDNPLLYVVASSCD